MKKILALIVFLPSFSFAWSFGSGGGVDYSRDAGASYFCASTGTVVTQAGVSISSPTISLYNPLNSGKYLTVLEVVPVFMAAPAAASVFELAFNVTPSSGVAILGSSLGTITSAAIGTSTGTLTTAKGVCTLQGRLPATPVVFRYLTGTTGAAAIGGVNAQDPTQGKIVIPPGGLLSLQTSSVAAAQASILWREDNL